MLRELWNDVRYRARTLTRRAAAEHSLHAEIDDHIAREAEALERSGLSPAEARRRARLAFGPLEQIKDESRAAWVRARRVGDAGRTLRRPPAQAPSDVCRVGHPHPRPRHCGDDGHFLDRAQRARSRAAVRRVRSPGHPRLLAAARRVSERVRGHRRLFRLAATAGRLRGSGSDAAGGQLQPHGLRRARAFAGREDDGQPVFDVAGKTSPRAHLHGG